MAQWDLAVTVTIQHKWETLWTETMNVNDDLFQYKRSRERDLLHIIEQTSTMAIKDVFKKYDENEWKK